MRSKSLLVLIVCIIYTSYCLDCDENQNGQSMSFFKIKGDLSLTGFFDVYDEKCSGPTTTGIHSMEMVATVVQILNSIHYVPGITLGLTLYEVCSHRSSDIQKAMISFVADQDCNNLTTPIAIYTTDDIRTKISDSLLIGLGVPISTIGPIINVDVHAESAVKFLTINHINVADVLIAQNLEVAQRFENIANVNGLCINKIILAADFRNLNDSSIVIIMTIKNVINLILDSSSNVHVFHYIIIPLDGPLSPKPEFEYGSYVFQAYGNCQLANKSDGVPVANVTDDGTSTTIVGVTTSSTGIDGATTEQVVSAQFVQTAADVLRIIDAYNGKIDDVECGGRNVSGECIATALGNLTETAVAVGYNVEATDLVLGKLLLLDDNDGEYNVTLVHVTEYGGSGETVGGYVQDSNGTRRLQLNSRVKPYVDQCRTDAPCPTCQRWPTTTAVPGQYGLMSIMTWKENVWIASTLTVAAVGAICVTCIATFILIRVCKKDVMEGNPTFSFVLIVGTLLMYASAVPFAVQNTSYPHVVCYVKLFGACVSCSIVFSAMLSRCMMIAACDCDSSFMSHVNGYLQTSLCAFTMCVQMALLLQFLAIHVIVPTSDLCRVFINGNLFLGSLSYDVLLLVLLCITTPFVFRSKRNYREGACFTVATYLMLVIWLCWCTAYAMLPRRWSDMCVMIGLTGTATVVVVTVFIPRTYMMMFGIVREQITSSLPSLGYGHGASVTDVNYRSTQALYDSVHVAPPKCQSSNFRGQSNPNYYSPAGSQIHSVPRSRPLTPVNEYDMPPTPDNRITRF